MQASKNMIHPGERGLREREHLEALDSSDSQNLIEFVTSKFEAALSPHHSDSPIDNDNAIWMISGYLFGNQNNPLALITDVERRTLLNNPQMGVVISRGVLHFCTKGTLDERLIRFLESELSLELKEKIKEEISHYLNTSWNGFPVVHDSVLTYLGMSKLK